MRNFFSSVLEILEIAVVAIVAVFVIRSFLVQPFLVSGLSMIPTFSNGDYLLVDELTYRFRAPERGEVIVFGYPGDPSTYFIKRIIGLPNECVVLGDSKITVFNSNSCEPPGLVLDEKYLPQPFVPSERSPFKLASDEYLVLGDNRSFSFDSRNWGPLKKDKIVGLVRLRLWPINDFKTFAAPKYQN
ncbi:MAG: signal peptidase I [Patescibacteria group bacterium]